MMPIALTCPSANSQELLASSAETLARRLLDQIRASKRSSVAKIHEEYTFMAAEVSRPCHTSEEVLGLKKYIQKCVGDQERLKDAIQRNKVGRAF